MPQALDEQRDLMSKWFGSIDLFAPLKFLQARGYRDDNGWIIKPTAAHTISVEEGECIDFLCDEWDFAGPVAPKAPSGG